MSGQIGHVTRHLLTFGLFVGLKKALGRKEFDG
jgi:hypothetical protein